MSDNKQGGKWSNPAFLISLVVGFYDELKNGSLPQEAKDRVEAKLHRDGFEDTTWDSVRYDFFLLSVWFLPWHAFAACASCPFFLFSFFVFAVNPGFRLSLPLPEIGGSRYDSHPLPHTLRTHPVSPNIFP